MRLRSLLTALPVLAATTGCANFATNIAGDFACRTGKEARDGCAPASQIDAATTSALGQAADEHTDRQRKGISSDDRARTSERMLRIVFPAHIDEAGTLHEEAVAWTVVAAPEWAASLRRKPGDDSKSPALEASRRLDPASGATSEALVSPKSPASGDPAPIDTDPFALASPLILPSTAREAIAGAKAPAVEGFDMPAPQHDRTPRSTLPETPLTYPSAAAIDAAKVKKERK